MPLLQQHLLQNKTLRKHTHRHKGKAPNSPNPKPSNTPKRKKKKKHCVFFKTLFRNFQKQNPHWILQKSFESKFQH
jgi:hypothetical protein